MKCPHCVVGTVDVPEGSFDGESFTCWNPDCFRESFLVVMSDGSITLDDGEDE